MVYWGVNRSIYIQMNWEIFQISDQKLSTFQSDPNKLKGDYFEGSDIKKWGMVFMGGNVKKGIFFSNDLGVSIWVST